MRNRKNPQPIEEFFWSRKDHCDITDTPPDANKQFGMLRYVQSNEYRPLSRKFDEFLAPDRINAFEIFLDKPGSQPNFYVVNQDSIANEMLESFIKIPEQKDLVAQVKTIKKWLEDFGHPIDNNSIFARINDIFYAAYSTKWLNTLLELACSEPKEPIKKKLKSLLKLEDDDGVLMYALPEGSIPMYKEALADAHQDEDYLPILRKCQDYINKFKSSNTVVTFSPDSSDVICIYNFVAFDDNLIPHLTLPKFRKIWNRYRKGQLNFDRTLDLQQAAKNYISSALGYLLAGVRPSICWKQDDQGDWIPYETMTLTNPWHAMNYELYKRLVSNEHAFKLCKRAGCNTRFRPQTMRRKYCSDACKQKKYRGTN